MAATRPAKRRRVDGSPLTAREQEVLELFAAGLSPRAIAAQLWVEWTTVKSTGNRIYRKLGVASRDEAVAKAAKLGILATRPVPYIAVAQPDPEARRRVAKVGAAAKWAKETDRTAATAAARKGFAARFERQVDPDGILDPAERARRAASARTEFYIQIAAEPRRSRKVATRD